MGNKTKKIANMEKTIQMLRTTFWFVIAITLLLVVLYGTELIHPYIYSEQAEFIATSIMEIATVTLLPLALYLFKTRTAREQFRERQWQALKIWGTVRLAMIGAPMIANLWLYYWCHNTSFFYLAVICAICMVFVYPSNKRCENEINPEV